MCTRGRSRAHNPPTAESMRIQHWQKATDPQENTSSGCHRDRLTRNVSVQNAGAATKEMGGASFRDQLRDQSLQGTGGGLAEVEWN